MTLKEVKLWLARIDDRKDDIGAAHSAEDDLYREFIQHVAEVGDSGLREMAIAVLTVMDIDFPRYHS